MSAAPFRASAGDCAVTSEPAPIAVQAVDASMGAAGRRSARRRRGWPIALGLLLLALGAVVLIALIPVEVEQPPVIETPPVNVEVWRVVAEPEMADALTLTAVIEPERVVTVAAEVAGRIECSGLRTREAEFRGRRLARGSTVAEGEPIERGEPLVCLNQELAQAHYDRALAQYEYDEREYRRISDLYERGATSKTELDDAGTNRAISRAALEEAARQLERTTIVAPASGILNRLPMEVGEYATPGAAVAEIVAIDRVKVVVAVPERDVHHLSVGDLVEVIVRNAAERVLSGRITYISELADEGTRTTRVEVTVDNRDHALRSGQIVRVRLTRRMLQDVIMIPLAAVIPLEEGRVVYLEREGQAERRAIELGFIKGRNVQVLSGLAAGEQLIVAGHRYVGPGQAVRVTAEVQGQP
jgi:membrane fusion protein (multidrug efflux system)